MFYQKVSSFLVEAKTKDGENGREWERMGENGRE
jgi:hypothetical protein